MSEPTRDPPRYYPPSVFPNYSATDEESRSLPLWIQPSIFPAASDCSSIFLFVQRGFYHIHTDCGALRMFLFMVRATVFVFSTVWQRLSLRQNFIGH